MPVSESTLYGVWLDYPYCKEAAVSTEHLWLGSGVTKLVICRQCKRQVPVRCVSVYVVDTSVTREAVER